MSKQPTPKITITVDAALVREAVREEVNRAVDAAWDDAAKPEQPPTELHGWWLRPDNRIWADRVVNHPRLGNGGPCLTGHITYLNREARVATSARTAYILFDEVRSSKEQS